MDQFYSMVELGMKDGMYEVHYSWTKGYPGSYDCPPEPPQYEIEHILDEDGEDVTEELTGEIYVSEPILNRLDGLIADDIESGEDYTEY